MKSLRRLLAIFRKRRFVELTPFQRAILLSVKETK